jgi:protein tyrosine/serine phosphatase
MNIPQQASMTVNLVNFREVHIGKIAPKHLYRSSHPVTGTEQDAAMAKLAETAKIATVLNLIDTKKTLNVKANCIQWYNKLFQDGCVIALDMDMDFFTGKSAKDINSGIKFMLRHNSPYLIHRLQGIDRTGFFVMLLEMLMGASRDEIIDNYMTSFLYNHGYKKGSDEYRFEYARIIQILEKLNGRKSLADCNLIEMAENYYFNAAGLNRGEIDLLKIKLSK